MYVFGELLVLPLSCIMYVFGELLVLPLSCIMYVFGELLVLHYDVIVVFGMWQVPYFCVIVCA